MGEIGSMLGIAGTANSAAGAGAAGAAAGGTVGGASLASMGAAELMGSGAGAGSTAGGVANLTAGAGMLSGAGDALSGAGAALSDFSAGTEGAKTAVAAAENAGQGGVDLGMVGKMKQFGSEVGNGFWNGLTTGDKVLTIGADKSVDWTQTLSKAAGRATQLKARKVARKVLGDEEEQRWKLGLANDFYNHMKN